MMKKYRLQIYSIIVGILVLFLSQLIVDIPSQMPRWPFFLLCSIIVFCYFTIINFTNQKKMVLNCFMTILLFGATISIIKPVQFGLDEESHLNKTIRIVADPFFERENETKGDYEQVFSFDGLRNTEYQGMGKWTEIEHEENKSTGNIVRLTNPAFFPAALGWKVGTVISKKIYISYYLGRIFNVLAYALLAVLALKISRYYKEIIYFLATFPAIIFVCSGYHYDYLYFGISLILLGMLVNYLKEEESIGRKQLAIFMATASTLAFVKFPYVLLGALVIILPAKQYKRKSDRLCKSKTFKNQKTLKSDTNT